MYIHACILVMIFFLVSFKHSFSFVMIMFQFVLDFWQVDELMGNMERAEASYSKAVQLLGFLLVEAPSLILNPPFSLTSSDRYRLRNYIDILNNRQGYSRSQQMDMLKCEDQQLAP